LENSKGGGTAPSLKGRREKIRERRQCNLTGTGNKASIEKSPVSN